MASKQKFSVVILAAGQGVRMASPIPKVLHPVAGIPMLLRVIRAAQKAGAEEVRVVVGHGEAMVRQLVEPTGATCLRQANQLGTADAVRSAQPESLRGSVMILNGDHPLITAGDIERIIEDHRQAGAHVTVITATLEEPGQYGRIVRQRGELQAIVEAKDASAETLKVQEVNTGLYVIEPATLARHLPKISNKNAQQEFYFTDIVDLARQAGETVIGYCGPQHLAMGVNSQAQLASATSFAYRRKCEELMSAGVIVIDPAQTYIEDSVQIGAASVVYPGCYLAEHSQVGRFCVLEPNSFLTRVQIGDEVHIRAGSYLEDCTVATKASIGPYARLRPGTMIGPEAKVGNFVEMKNVVFGAGAKASHLTYLGDADVGDGTNIGCGTITCNYAPDHKKYRTTIGQRVFVGSDVQFVAPVEIGDEAVIGSGSTITKAVPPRALAVARGRQIVKENYVARKAESDEDKAK